MWGELASYERLFNPLSKFSRMGTQGPAPLLCTPGRSVGLSVHISPQERPFVLKTISRTLQTRKVKIFVWISLKLLHWTSILETAHAHYLRFASTRGAEGYYARLAASVDGARARTGKCACPLKSSSHAKALRCQRYLPPLLLDRPICNSQYFLSQY